MNEQEKKEYKRKYYERNRDILIEKSKKHHQDNLEKIKIQRKEYRERNKEKIKIKKKADYEKNKEKRKIGRKKYRDKIMDNFLSYKTGKCCSVCGYKEYPEILQFHHKDKNKSFNISTLRKTSDQALLKAEIDKCVLLCPNCHSWLHYQETKPEIVLKTT